MSVISKVDLKQREKIEAHHTATHLLHAALRHVLGSHISQAGSLVDEDRLRFDFNHPSALTRQQLEDVEAWVQRAVSAGVPLVTEEMAKEQALSLGAMAMFGEKYGDTVRTVKVFPSLPFPSLPCETGKSKLISLVCFFVCFLLKKDSRILSRVVWRDAR